MTEDSKKHGFATRLSHAGRAGTHVHGFVNPAVHRGSTVLFPNVAARREGAKHRFEQYMTYGTQGGPTHYAFEDVIAEIEGGTHALIVGTGLAAVAVPLLAYLKAGDHCLMPDSCYGPARNLCDGLLKGWGIETTYYDPCIDAAGLAALFRPSTKVLYTESPGSHTFEVQDVPALAEVAHAKGARLLMDNTWGIHHFKPFEKGVDVSIQALTKYVGGHSDVLLGSVTVNTEEDWKIVRGAASLLGQYASPDDVWLGLRGVRTMAVRLQRQAASGLEVARWLEARPEVQQVLHPALPSHPQHALWKRDFTGACSLFGVVFQPRYTVDDVGRFIDALQLFGIGASWGGYESLAILTTGNVTRTAGSGEFGGPMARIHVGLEEPADLIADLEQGLAKLRG
ncbi:cystathionine beta-lyase [Siccirubricoccus sp. KC 17139]|uniref:Cystathionine beta-lyase n=1 Tax=Siccirubricoccus soli TaxID=2899147 RepID=A0ABT1D9N5_9PROT|nr:cystathionine beta-lyase [Siccirubricoccus soli]MCO6418641.1 cystathionine beta-lyase [Siccirubricoccus soli]MCP2684776.1 cystathionine beta-lyase [Siccirubricoccus soli]